MLTTVNANSQVTANLLLTAALLYARFGWYVIPVGPRTKKPLVLDWTNAASRDPVQIMNWWARWPWANVGIACGKSGLVVIDVDTYKGPDWTRFAERTQGVVTSLEVLQGMTPWQAHSGGGGHHLIFSADPLRDHNEIVPFPLRCRIDKRSAGGMFVVEPSLHAKTGKPYQWACEALAWIEEGREPPALPECFYRAPGGAVIEDVDFIEDTSLPELPPFLVVLLEECPDKGERSEHFFHIAMKFFEIGLSPQQVLAHYGELPWIPERYENRKLEELQRVFDKWRDKGAKREVPHARAEDEFEPILDFKKGSLLHGAYTGAELKDMELEHRKYVCAGLIPAGCSLLGAKPKGGKSYWCLQLAIAVATGGEFLGRHCEPGYVLYLALEDGKARMKERMAKFMGSAPWPSKLLIKHDWPKGQDAIKGFHEWIDAVPGPVLILVDTLEKIKLAPKSKNGANYSDDYAAGALLQDFSRKTGVSVIVMHHTRKSDAEDPFDTLSGTLGNTAAFDTLYVIKAYAGRKGARLHAKGRDLDPLEMEVHRDVDTGGWLVGKAAEEEVSEEDYVAEWLRDKLRHGPHLRKDLVRQAEEDGICRRTTLDRVARRLGISGSGSVWKLNCLDPQDEFEPL